VSNITIILILNLCTQITHLSNPELASIFSTKIHQELAAQRVETYSERVDKALLTYLDTQGSLDSLLDDYNEAVYEDGDITNINQQQLRSTVFNIILLNYITRQN